jgi:hypothetical protein
VIFPPDDPVKCWQVAVGYYAFHFNVIDENQKSDGAWHSLRILSATMEPVRK